MQETYEKGMLKSNYLRQCLSLCTIHKAVVSENLTLINSGTPVVYVDNSLFNVSMFNGMISIFCDVNVINQSARAKLMQLTQNLNMFVTKQGRTQDFLARGAHGQWGTNNYI